MEDTFCGALCVPAAWAQAAPATAPSSQDQVNPLPQAGSPETGKSPGAQTRSEVGTAQTPTPSTGQAPPAAQEKKEEETTFVDVLHGGISRTILSTATWLDSFFGDRRYLSEQNQSYVRFRYNAFFEKGSPSVLKPAFTVRLVLPQLREKTHIFIEGMPKEEKPFSATQTNSPTEQVTTTEERNVTTAVGYKVRESAEQSFFLVGGAKFHARSIAFTVGPRYRLQFILDSWTLRFVEDLSWRTDLGWLSRSTFDIERPLPHELFFRATTDVIETERVPGFSYAQSFVIRQPITPVRAVEYEWVNIFQTRPVSELLEVDLRIRYRQRIWRDWLYLEVTPQYRFPRDRSFDATPGILFSLDTIFGHLE